MANMHLVTGYAGQEHITAADQGAFNAALIGTGQFVLDNGKVFEAQVISNNQIRVLDGELMMQGRFIRLNPDTYVDLTIENGAQGMKRNDLIAVRYTKDTLSGVEDANLVVIKGTPAASDPADPSFTEGDIANGQGVLNDFPLWRIPIDGLDVGTPESMFGDPFMDSMRTLPEIRKAVESIHAEVDKQLEEQNSEIDKKIAGISAYTKDETLTNTTKTLYGLGEDAVPDDVLRVLSRFHSGLGNEYLWEKAAISEAIILDNALTTINIPYGMGASFYMQYADEAKIVDGVFTIINPSTATFPMDASTAQNLAKLLPNKYIKEVLTDTGEVLLQGFCISASESGGGLSISYKKATVADKREVVGYVNSSDPNAYPVDDGCTYAPMGRLGNKVQIATGSYAGTGTYGGSNPNKLTFDFPVKVLIVRAATSSVTEYGAIIISEGDIPIESYASSVRYMTVTSLGTTVSWYTSDVYMQLNAKGYQYAYVAIG